MRKHFLILMLMALLPLAGWAQAVDISDGWSIELTPATAIYSGTDQTPTVTLKKGSNVLNSTNFNVEWNATEIKTVSGTGYTVTVTNDMTHTYGNLATPTKTFWILKATPSQDTAGELKDDDNLTVGNQVAYTGNDITLVKTAPVVKLDDTGTTNVTAAVIGGKILYSLDEQSWSEDLPKAKKVGTYHVYYKVEGTDNYNGLPSHDMGTITITGTALVENTDYTAPTALGADINFDNQNHDLVNAGEALTDKCTMKYSLDGETWGDAVPQRKDVANYTVYWKAEGIPGYYDATGNFAAKIVAVAPTVTSAVATTDELTYNGLDQNLLKEAGTATIGATPVYTIAYKAPGETSYGAAGDPVAYNAVTGKNAGWYKITTKVVAGGNYLEASAAAPVEVEIEKAELTVKTDNKTRHYGEANPTLTCTYEGFVNGETATVITGAPTLSTTATVASGVEKYTITAAHGTETAVNYSFVFDAANFGKLTITPYELDLNAAHFDFTLAADTKVFTGEALTNSVASAMFKVPTTPVAMNFPTDYTFVVTNNTNAGTANVIITGQGNYKGSVIKTFAITPKPVYVKPRNNSKAYGADDPDPITTYDLIATLDGDPIAGATLDGTVVLDRIAGENAGTYKIYVKSFTAGATANYTIATDANSGTGKGQILDNAASTSDYNLTASFVVTGKTTPLKLKFDPNIAANKKTKVYGETNPVWTINDLVPVAEGEEGGFVGDDTWADVKPTLSAPVFTLTSPNVVTTEPNTVTVSGISSTNYPYVTVEPLEFEVTARPITVTVGDQNITYGTTELTAAAAAPGTNWEVTTGSIVGGDELGISFKTANNLLTYAVSADPYQVIDAEITNTNYNLTVVKGNLTVNPGTSIVLNRENDMDALIKAYDGEDINVVLNRNITRTEAWFAMVLPFPTTMTELVEKFGYCVVNVLDESNTDASKVKFKLAFGTIAANQPFLVKLGTAISAPVNFGSKHITYDAAPLSEDVAHNKFYGVFKMPTTLTVTDPENSHYWMMISKDDKFKKVVADQEVSPINCYLETYQVLDAFAPSIFVEDMDGSVTAINVVDGDAMQKNAEGWYTINGMKLNAAPTEKGIYINNGKKVIIK